MRRAVFFALLTIAVIGHGDHGATLNATSIPLGTPAMPQAHGPSAFVPNVGQWTHPACFVARLAGGAVFAEEARLLLSWQAQRDGDRVHGAAIGMRFQAPATGEVVPEQRLAGVHHYLLGNDPARWRSDVPRYRAVRYRGQWPGVAVLCYEQDGHFEYDVELEPNADLAQVEFTVEGSTGLWIDGDGALVIDTPAGPLRQARPATHVELGGERRAIAAAYELRGPDRFGFVAPEWNGDGVLVLDPGLLWSTVLGGSMADSVAAVATGANGVVTIAGTTQSADYPISIGAWSTSFVAGSDAVLTRLDPSLPAAQQLLWSTFLGASSQDWARALAVDATGIVTVTGYTLSQGFPTTAGAWDRSINGFGDAFVARLDPSLPAPQQLLYSTYYGGNDEDVPQALCVDGAGRVTIAGETASNSLPMPANAWMAQAHAYGDGFVARLDPSLPGAQQLVYATYVGTHNMAPEGVHGLAVDANGVITMAGWTADPAFPTTPGAWNRTSAGVFVTRLDPSTPAQQLRYSTFVGSGSVRDLAVDAAGIVTISGNTSSGNWPTTAAAWDRSYHGGGDVFVTRLDPSLPAAQQLLWSTFVGGGQADLATGLSVDAGGVVTVAGRTDSTDWPTTAGSWDRSRDGTSDAFVLRLDPSLPGTQQLVYSTLIGGAASDAASSLAVDAAGFATIGGSSSNWLPTAGAWNGSPGGNGDGMVARLDLLPTGVAAYGTSTPGCTGPLRVGVCSWPQVGNASFQGTCAGAPANGTGLLAIGTAGRTVPVTIAGAQVWIDLQGPTATVFETSNALGLAYVPLPLPANPALTGLRVFLQFLWIDGCATGGVSASNALAITVQP